MGNITSRQATNLIDSFVLRLARTIDAVLRSINRRLSSLSSFIFSRLFGYDVVFAEDAPTELVRKDSLVCGPGNVCIVPASRIQQREVEKRRRSERRKRAEAAARGERVRRQGGYARVESAPSSPVNEKGMYQVKAPAARPLEERETVAERERGRLWVMGNVQPSPTVQRVESVASSPTSPITPASPSTPIDIQQRIQPRKSSKHAQHRLLAITSASAPKIAPLVEKDESLAEAGFDSGHMMPRLHAPQPRLLPPGALSLGPSPWDDVAFRHPFSPDHEPLMTSKAKHQLRAHHQRPKLSLDTHVESSPLPDATPTFADDLPTRPPSAASRRTPVNLARKSIDAISLRSSVDLSHLDVKTLATKAVKEEKGRKVWKDQVDRLAKEKCLAAGGAGGRRYSLAAGDALTRVRTADGEGVGAGRRGSMPGVAGMASGRSTPVCREGSPLCR